MVDVSYPGVYIQEVPSGVHTITGVSTSVTAFLGRTSKGPVNKAVRILSLAAYARKFGKPHPKSQLADSVRLFFANGGTDCYVIRLAKGAKKASLVLRTLQNQAVLKATAKAEGGWGNTVRLKVDYKTSNPDETFNLQVIHEEGGTVVATENHINLSMDPNSSRFAPTFVSQSSDLIDLTFESTGPLGDPTNNASFYNTIANSFAGFSQARRRLADTAAGNFAAVKATFDSLFSPPAPKTAQSKFDISVNNEQYVTVDLNTPPAIPNTSFAAIANNIRDKLNMKLGEVSPKLKVSCSISTIANVGRFLTITADDTDGDKVSVRVRRASSNDVAAALMLGVEQGGIEAVRWANFRPAPNGVFLQLGDFAGGAFGLEDVDAISAYNQDGVNRLTEIKIDGTAVKLDTAPNDLQTVTAAGARWYQSATVTDSPHDNNDGVREKLRIIAKAINATAGLSWKAEVWGYHLVLIPEKGTINTEPATITPTAVSNTRFDLSHADTAWISNIWKYSLGTANEGTTFVPTGAGDDGLDGTVPTAAEYIGNEADQKGFYALDPVDIFNLMVIPGDEEVDQTVLNAIWGPASTYCEKKRAFLLIDSPSKWVKSGRTEVVQDTTMVGDLRSLVVKENSAVFYPHLKYGSNGLTKKIGPSGAIAGLMARTDSTRGVWKAPAGVDADLRNVLGLEVELTDMENGVLNKLGVNCLRAFPSGFVNWGARTMDGSDDLGSEWKYIPIRRLALFLEESLFRGTKWVVFEPNDEPLWAKIRLNLNAFMMRLFKQGAFQGSSPDLAFYVKCDGETTTQADRNLGIVNIEVGFAPLKPAEFVVIKIQQIAGEL